MRNENYDLHTYKAFTFLKNLGYKNVIVSKVRMQYKNYDLHTYITLSFLKNNCLSGDNCFQCTYADKKNYFAYVQSIKFSFKDLFYSVKFPKCTYAN